MPIYLPDKFNLPVTVTQDHISNGKKLCGSKCPVSLAVLDVLVKLDWSDSFPCRQCFVSQSGVYLNFLHETKVELRYHADSFPILNAFIYNFDVSGQEMPTTFLFNFKVLNQELWSEEDIKFISNSLQESD